MLYQTTIPVSNVSKEKILQLIDNLQEVTNKRAEVDECLVLSTDDTELSAMFDSLADAVRDGNGSKPDPKIRKKRVMKTQPSNVSKPAPTRGPHVRSMQILGTTEMISRYELDQRLAAFSIEVGTKLHSPKHGTITVEANGSDTLVAVNEKGERI